MKKLMVALIVACAALGAFAETTGDYVQENLIACWDAYANDGAGGHATSLTEWKDTSGRYSFVFHANSGIVVGDSSLVFSGAGGCYAELTAADTAATFDLATDGTLEVVFRGASDQPATCLMLHSSPASGIAVGSYTTQTKWIVATGKNSPCPIFDAREGITTLALHYNGGFAQDPHVDGEAVSTSGSGEWSGVSGQSTTTLGARANKSSLFKGEVCAIRLYSTKLTTEQIAANRAVDVKRFVEGKIDLGCGIVAQRFIFACGSSETVSATALGDTTGIRYFWDVDGDGTFEAEGERQEVKFATPGEHVVTLKVTNAAGEEATSARTFTIRPPLDVPSASYPDIATALAAAEEGDVVLLAAETYKTSECGAAEDALYPVDVPAGVEIRGGGATPADTVIDAEYAGRILRLAAGAKASNLTLANCQLLESQRTTVRGVALDARKATVEDCVIRDGKVGAVATWEHFAYLEGATMRRTTVTNCVYTGSATAIWGASAGVAIYAAAGSTLEYVTVEDCSIKGGGGNNINLDAPVVLSASSMSHSIVRRNSTTYNEGAGALSAGGVSLFGASTLADTLVENNSAPVHNGTVAGGINMFYKDAPVIERCIVRSNAVVVGWGNTPTISGGILASYGSTLRNCLICGNSGPANASVALAASSAGGVTLRTNSGSATGRMENCTVYGNSLVGNPNAAGVHMSDWTVVNSIVYGNKATLTGGSVTYSLMPDAVEGEGNITGDPLFVDEENGDFKLTYASPCVDSGTELASVTVDLEGAARPQDAKLSGTARTDRGCYEMPPNDIPLDCSLSVPVPLAAAPYDVTLTAEVTGSRKTGLSYAWVCIGVYADATTRVEKATSEPTCVFEDLGYGTYTFELTVTNDHEPQPDVATAVARDALQVSASVCYVSPNGGSVWPYANAADAATNLCDAAAATTEKVSVLPGSYAAMRHVTDADTGHDALVILSRPISIEGPSDPSAAVINCAGGGGLILGNAGAKVSGLTLTNFMTTAGLKSSALNIAAGTVSNVVLRAKKTVVTGSVSPVVVRGLLTDSVLTGISISDWGGVPLMSVRGVGTLRKVSVVGNTITTHGLLQVAAENGLRPRLENCTISGNKPRDYGLHMTSADAVGCNILSNTVSNGSMVYTSSGTILRRCRIFGNTSSSASVIMATYQRQANATQLENCLIARNTVTGSSVSAVNVSANQGGAKIANCTIADNATKGGTGVVANVGTDGKAYLDMVNTIVAGHVAASGTADVSATPPDATIKNSCFAEAVEDDGNGNIAKDPKFKGRGKAPYALKLGSPCLAVGDASRWTDTDVDLVGNPRLIKGAVDMGCYENLIKGLMLMLK